MCETVIVPAAQTASRSRTLLRGLPLPATPLPADVRTSSTVCRGKSPFTYSFLTGHMFLAIKSSAGNDFACADTITYESHPTYSTSTIRVDAVNRCILLPPCTQLAALLAMCIHVIYNAESSHGWQNEYNSTLSFGRFGRQIQVKARYQVVYPPNAV